MIYGLPPAAYAGGSMTSGSASDRGPPEGRARSNADRFSWLVNGAYVLLDYISTIDRDLSFSFGGFSMKSVVVDAILKLTQLAVLLDEQLDILDMHGLHYEIRMNVDPDVPGHFYFDLVK